MDLSNNHTKTISSWSLFVGIFITYSSIAVLSLLSLSAIFWSFVPDSSIYISNFSSALFIWLLLVTGFSLFVGSWITGRIANKSKTVINGCMHGLILWSLSTILSIVLAFSSIGFILGGASSVMYNSVKLMKNISPDINMEIDSQGFKNIKSQIIEVLDKNKVNKSVINSIINYSLAYFQASDELKKQDIKDRIVKILINNSSLTEEQVNNIFNKWSQTFNEIKYSTKSLLDQTKVIVGRGLSKTFIFLFFINIFGLLMSMSGGYMGYKKD